MWCLFGYYWYVVSGREIGAATIQALGILAVVIILGLILTIWWVAHNKKLAQRNRRSSTPITQPETFEKDYLGRHLTGPAVDVLQQAQVVDIHLSEDQDDGPGSKIYSVAGEGGV